MVPSFLAGSNGNQRRHQFGVVEGNQSGEIQLDARLSRETTVPETSIHGFECGQFRCPEPLEYVLCKRFYED